MTQSPLPPRSDSTPYPSESRPSRTALILGGGGSAGNAWLIGVIAGLLEGGLDVTTADLIVGTSAGATTAAQITGASPARLLSDILGADPPARQAAADAPTRQGGERSTARPGLDRTHLDRTNAVIAASADAADMRRRMAAELATHAMSTPAGRDRWRATVAARLPRAEWPVQRLVITAVDASTAEPVLFDRDSGVDLVDAVAASTAGGFVYGIDGRGYIDGGYRANAENADLASGYAKVLVMSPFGGRTRLPLAWRLDLSTQVEDLRAAGSDVVTVHPDGSAREAFGDDMMSPASRRPAARAGHAHGTALAAELGSFWR